MLTWLSVMGQATAAVILRYQIKRVQFHDYHGTLALLHIPKKWLPSVLYVAQNAVSTPPYCFTISG